METFPRHVPLNNSPKQSELGLCLQELQRVHRSALIMHHDPSSHHRLHADLESLVPRCCQESSTPPVEKVRYDSVQQSQKFLTTRGNLRTKLWICKVPLCWDQPAVSIEFTTQNGASNGLNIDELKIPLSVRRYAGQKPPQKSDG
jgi:hypothetical protein